MEMAVKHITFAITEHWDVVIKKEVEQFHYCQLQDACQFKE